MNKVGNLFIVAAPSGTGKTSLVKALVESLDNIQISVSHTTRPRRANEQDQKDYYFISEEKFQTMIQQHEFLEYAEVYNYRYGTSQPWVFEKLEQGVDVVLEIDWQGARLVSQRFPDAVTVFILPPSMDELRKRLVTRQRDLPAVIEMRLTQVREEVVHHHEFDYLVVNDSFGHALENLKHIVLSERLRTKNQIRNLAPLLEKLLEF